MATITTSNQLTPITIDKFLGLNIALTGDTQIKNGESGNMTNWYITDDFKLKKMYGYKSIYTFNSKIQGRYVSKIGNEESLLIATNGHLYQLTKAMILDEENWDLIVPIDLGELTDEETTFFSFNNKVYILNGHEYKVWDGTILKDVEGYIPKVFISSTPEGSGTDYEPINILTGKKHMTFNGNGTSTVFHLPEKNIQSVDKVIVNTQEISSYTKDLINGTVTLNTAPSEAMDNVDIYWTKENGDRHFIESMRAGIIFGGDTDTKVFLYGSHEEQNRIRYSGVANLVPSVEYFPAVNQIDVGATNFAITDLRRHYDRLLVTTNKPEAYYITLDLIDIEGYTTVSPQTFPLNEAHGNIAFNQGQVINNDPVTFETGSIIRWKSTNVRDERNMNDISQKIKKELLELDLRNVKSFDYSQANQLLVSINNTIYIYNYYNDTYSKIVIPHIACGFFDFENELYMTTETGEIAKFGEYYDTFDGEIIKAHWEMNFSDFGVEYRRKTMNRLWVLMQAQAKASAEIGYISNKNESLKKKIEYSLSVLDDVDFSEFSFQVSNNPQPFRLKMKAKKFTNLKIVIDNNEKTDATILALSLRVELGGESK